MQQPHTKTNHINLLHKINKRIIHFFQRGLDKPRHLPSLTLIFWWTYKICVKIPLIQAIKDVPIYKMVRGYSLKRFMGIPHKLHGATKKVFTHMVVHPLSILYAVPSSVFSTILVLSMISYFKSSMSNLHIIFRSNYHITLQTLTMT